MTGEMTRRFHGIEMAREGLIFIKTLLGAQSRYDIIKSWQVDFSMSEVKGSVFLNVARLVRANKDVDWKKYLNDKDLEIIHGQILASSRYPLDTYERAEIAVFREIGKGQLENARQWGRFMMENMFKTVYHDLVRDQDPALALERFALIVRMLYRFNDPKFEALKYVKMPGDRARIIVKSDHPVREFEAHSHQSMGTIEKLVELSGGKDDKIEITECDWQNDNPFALLDVSWKK